MYVCVCRAVTEHEVKATIDQGAKTVEAVTRSCCAGDDCGACHDFIEDMIEERWGAVGGPGSVRAQPDGAVHLPVVTEQGRAA
jgi:bacterioferritin-associated ferredoxin